MSQQVVFTRAFARLVWLLVYRQRATDEHKQALRAALLEVRDEGFVVSLADLNRSIATAATLTPAPAELPWLHELAARLAGHSVSLLDFSPGSKAGDILGVARTLATAPALGDDGANFDALVAALQLGTVSARLGRGGFVRRPTPMAGVRARPAGAARTPALGIFAVDGLPATHALVPPQHRIGAPTPTSAHPRFVLAADRAEQASEQELMVEAAFTQTGERDGLELLLARLDGAQDARSAPDILDDLTHVGEDMAREGRWAEVAQLLHRVVEREAQVQGADVRRAFVIHLRRLFKPGILRGLTQLLTKHRELRPAVEAVFVRSGGLGADVLIDLLVTSNQAAERRAIRTVLVRCQTAVEPLIHLLRDPRWYVVRNAAELLGEMGAEPAESALLTVLRHSDARVRRSTVGALARLGSARGTHALQPMLQDTNAAVRLSAVHGLSAARLPRSVPALLSALERERDPEIQHALLAALGAHPTDASVERLAEAAKPGSLLNRKATSYRVAAVLALGEAGTPMALAALRVMQGDRDGEVRSAVERALASHAQGVVTTR